MLPRRARIRGAKTLVSLSSRLQDLLGAVSRVKKKKKKKMKKKKKSSRHTLIPSSASVGTTDYYKVDILRVRYRSSLLLPHHTHTHRTDKRFTARKSLALPHSGPPTIFSVCRAGFTEKIRHLWSGKRPRLTKLVRPHKLRQRYVPAGSRTARALTRC